MHALDAYASPPCVYVARTDGHAIERASQNFDLTATLAPSLAITSNHREYTSKSDGGENGLSGMPGLHHIFEGEERKNGSCSLIVGGRVKPPPEFPHWAQ